MERGVRRMGRRIEKARREGGEGRWWRGVVGVGGWENERLGRLDLLALSHHNATHSDERRCSKSEFFSAE